MSALKDSSAKVKNIAIDSLSKRGLGDSLAKFNERWLRAVVSKNDEAENAADALSGQTKLDEATLALLVKLLADKANPSGQGYAALALRGQTKLDEATLALLGNAAGRQGQSLRARLRRPTP